MNRRFSISIHDLKISGDEITAEKIQHVINIFKMPLTVHLVFDRPLGEKSVLFKFLIENVKKNNIEIVFHGLTHRCSKGLWKIISFYHKYQAEYLEDSDILRSGTEKRYTELSALLQSNPGICPPCWIASKKNLLFLKKLNPLYIESILAINYKSQRIFSPVISLGSSRKGELFFLRMIARTMYFLSILIKKPRARIAVHECDLAIDGSINFFVNIVNSLKRHFFQAVLLKNFE